MRSSSKVRYTYRDYLSIPEHAPGRHEIVDGELLVTPLPRFNHQLVALNLAELLRAHVRPPGLGEVVGPITVHLHDELVLEPDVVFIRQDRLDIVDPEGDIHGPPDLVVEVLSPGTRAYDETLKRERYLESGVPELWLVDIDRRRVAVWRPGADGAEVVEDALSWRVGEERFRIPLEEVFGGVREAR